MITIEEIIQRVQSQYSRGVQSDDSRLTSRHIYSKIKSARSRVLSQKMNKKQMISQWFYQTLPCVELERAVKHECPEYLPEDQITLRSKFALPAPISGANGGYLQSVTSFLDVFDDPSEAVVYDEIEWKRLKYKAANKYTSNRPGYYIRNGFLYVTQKTGPRILTITGLFEDPVEAYDIINVDNIGCVSPLELDFPLEGALVEAVVALAAEELIGAFKTNVEDKASNSTEDSNNTSGNGQRRS